MIPIFLDGEQADDGESSSSSPYKPKPRLQRRFDTTLVLTNATDAELAIALTVWDAAGLNMLVDPAINANANISFGPHETKEIPLSQLL